MPHKKGMRVGAICGMVGKSKVLHFFGYGVYLGKFIPPPTIGIPFANPKIKLDCGDVVWGCECWWGPEDQIKASIEQYKAQGVKVETITVKKYRGIPDLPKPSNN